MQYPVKQSVHHLCFGSTHWLKVSYPILVWEGSSAGAKGQVHLGANASHRVWGATLIVSGRGEGKDHILLALFEFGGSEDALK